MTRIPRPVHALWHWTARIANSPGAVPAPPVGRDRAASSMSSSQRLAVRASGATGIALALVASLAIPTPVAATPANTFYVDGKTGNDANDGRSPSSAYQTIRRAADAIPLGGPAAGYHIIVRGYTDYVYRERPISPGWNRAGASGAPIVFEASGYVGGGSGYVKPIVSGADAAPAPGGKWELTGTAGVWRTRWSSRPFDYGRGLNTAIFQDLTIWLWERSSLSDLRSSAASGAGGYAYNSGWLYVAPLGDAAFAPTKHSFDVVMRNAFFFKGERGVSRVEVRGFEVRHAANGIAFRGGVDHSVAADNRLVGNLYMGIQTVGNDAGGSSDSASRNTIRRNVFVANTLQGIKIDRGTKYSTFCDNDISASGLAGIKIQGAPPGISNTLTTRGNTICNNDLHDNTFNRTGSSYANTSGITIANGARYNTITGNRIYRNLVGVHVTQEGRGRLTLEGNRLKSNEIWGNSRYGVYFYDGVYGSGGGRIVSSHDVIWSNGAGVRVDRGSTHKELRRDTIFRSHREGVRVGLAGGAYAHVLVKQSLVTNNGTYGVYVRPGSKAKLAYVGIRGNRARAYRGKVVRKYVNKWVPGYLSKEYFTPDFLRIAKTSPQYTAGPNRTPIGARW